MAADGGEGQRPTADVRCRGPSARDNCGRCRRRINLARPSGSANMVLDDRSTAGRACLALLIFAVTTISAQAAEPAGKQASPFGLFQAESDIGNVVPAGSAHYDAARQVYTIASAGANTWYHVDHFNYLWTRASGDLAITARISFPLRRYGHDPNPHRKGLLMFRQSLAPGSAYV